MPDTLTDTLTPDPSSWVVPQAVRGASLSLQTCPTRLTRPTNGGLFNERLSFGAVPRTSAWEWSSHAFFPSAEGAAYFFELVG